MMIIERYIARSKDKLAPGKHKIEVDTTIAKFGGPAEVTLTVDGKEVARTTVKRTVPAAFTASETFDVGVDLGSPVSLDYFDRRPFKLIFYSADSQVIERTRESALETRLGTTFPVIG
jgi:arylsulfatase